LTIIVPAAFGTASGSSHCGVSAFNDQPTWGGSAPTGDEDPNPHSDTETDYANRYFYIDFGTNWANVRIVQTWTRYRPNSPGSYSGLSSATMWWDDENNTSNEGGSGYEEDGLDWGTATSVSNSGSQLWIKDVDHGIGSPITPLGRYLVVGTGGTTPSSRPNEFAIVGYIVP
jgi:hypothetical protein